MRARGLRRRRRCRVRSARARLRRPAAAVRAHNSPASEKRTRGATVRVATRASPVPAPPSSKSHITENTFRPQIRRDYPPDLSILISGGKENNRDSPSSGERTGKSPSPNPAAHFRAAARMGVVAYGPASLPGRTRRSKSPLNGAMARRWCQASRGRRSVPGSDRAFESGCLRVQPEAGGKLHLRLNTATRPIVDKYREGKLKRTLKREFIRT